MEAPLGTAARNKASAALNVSVWSHTFRHTFSENMPVAIRCHPLTELTHVWFFHLAAVPVHKSTSTVGFPRESKISRALIAMMVFESGAAAAPGDVWAGKRLRVQLLRSLYEKTHVQEQSMDFSRMFRIMPAGAATLVWFFTASAAALISSRLPLQVQILLRRVVRVVSRFRAPLGNPIVIQATEVFPKLERRDRVCAWNWL